MRWNNRLFSYTNLKILNSVPTVSVWEGGKDPAPPFVPWGRDIMKTKKQTNRAIFMIDGVVVTSWDTTRGKSLYTKVSY